MSQEPLLRVENLEKHFPVRRGLFGKVVGQVRAVDGVSFEMMPGETLGLVGESGCGKTTIGRAILYLDPPTAGKVYFEGKDVGNIDRVSLRDLRRDMQIIFQDPFSSLNPRMRILDIVGESLEVHGIARGNAMQQRVAELLQKVGVSSSWINRYPHEFSGGQRQRIGVARAIALNPKLIVCDEAVSALDVSIQAQVLNLLIRLRQELGLAYLFISHDLSVVRHISQRILVMYLGQIVEVCPTQELFRFAANPYTRALLSAVPVPNPRHRVERVILSGDVPTPLNPPSGCRFHTRCPVVFDRCPKEQPPLYPLKGGRQARCFHAEGLEGKNDWQQELERRFERAAAERRKADLQAKDVAPTRATAAPSSAASTASATAPNAPAKPGLDGTFAPEAEAPFRATESDPIAAARPAEPPTPGTETRASEAHVEGSPSTKRLLCVGAGVVLAMGIALVLSGSWTWGFLLSVLPYSLVLRRYLGRPMQADLVLVTLLAGSLYLSTLFAQHGKSQQARAELSALRSEVIGYEKATGEYPKALSDLDYRLSFVFGREKPLDPWGRPYVYRPSKEPAPNGAAIQLYSLGPDGAKSSDDIYPSGS